MAKFNNILSIYINGRDIKTILSTYHKGKIRLNVFDHVSLLSPLPITTLESLEAISEENGDVETAEDVFGIDSASETEIDSELSADDESGLDKEAPEPSLDMVGDVDENLEEESESNHDIILGLYTRIATKKYSQAINLPRNLVNTIRLSGNYSQMKPRDRRKQILADVQDRMERHIPENNLKYFLTPEGDVYAFVFLGQIPLIKITDEIQKHIKSKQHYTHAAPNDIILTNLLFYNYNIDAEEIIALVNIDDNDSSFLIAKGKSILYLSYPIQKGLNSPDLLNSVSGKVLYEHDLGRFPEFTRIILTGQAKKIDAMEFFQTSFPEVEVEYLKLDPEKFELPEDNQAEIVEYAIPIGLAITSHQPKTKDVLTHNFLPDYVVRRQKVMKLAWHGVILLLLILSSPMGIDWLYKEKTKTYNESLSKSANLNIAITDLEWVSPIVDSLANDYSINMAKLALLDTLSKGTLRWSVTYSRIYEALMDLDGLWITNFKSKPRGIELSGISLYRDRISKFNDYFADAEIVSVVPSNIREKPVYQFAVNVNKVTNDLGDYNPKVSMPQPHQLEFDDTKVKPVYSDEEIDTIGTSDIHEVISEIKPDTTPVLVEDDMLSIPVETDMIQLDSKADSIEPIVIHRVNSGETLKSISIKYFGTDSLWKEIYEFNCDLITDPNKINLKQPLVILSDLDRQAVAYTVKAGDNLKLLAEKFFGDENRWEKLYELNETILPNPNVIHVGQEITIYTRVDTNIVEQTESIPMVFHRVVSGETLKKISKKYYDDESKWEEIYELNKDIILNPNIIHIGQELKINTILDTNAIVPIKSVPIVIHKVVFGESLKEIADMYLGDENRWEEIYKLNHDQIFNIDYIYVGQKLKVPDEMGISGRNNKD